MPTLKSESSLDPFHRGWHTLKQILFHPSLFFSLLDVKNTLGGALALSLTVVWVAAFLNSVLNRWLGLDAASFFQMIENAAPTLKWSFFSSGRLELFEMVRNTSLVLLKPFTALFTLSFKTIFIYLGARLFLSPGRNSNWVEPSFSTVMTLLAFAMVAAVFSIIPWIGSPIASMYEFILGVIAFQKVFHISAMRASMIMLFPFLILMLPVLFILTAFLFLGGVGVLNFIGS